MASHTCNRLTGRKRARRTEVHVIETVETRVTTTTTTEEVNRPGPPRTHPAGTARAPVVDLALARALARMRVAC